MMRLVLDPPPAVLTVAEGITITLKVAGTEALLAGRRAVRLAVDENPEADTQLAFVRGFVGWGATDWSGIGDERGEPLPFSTAGLFQLMHQRFDIYCALDADYVAPVVDLMAEKKGSAPSPTGTSAGAPPIATPARRERKRKSVAPAPIESTSPIA